MKLNAKKIGFVSGLIWAFFLSLLTILAVLFPPYGDLFLKTIASVYPGFSISWMGVCIGFVYGFIDAFCGGVIFAWVYNLLEKK